MTDDAFLRDAIRSFIKRNRFKQNREVLHTRRLVKN